MLLSLWPLGVPAASCAETCDQDPSQCHSLQEAIKVPVSGAVGIVKNYRFEICEMCRKYRLGCPSVDHRENNLNTFIQWMLLFIV